ncbi:hypothetical protein ACNJ7E_30970 [Rhodococcus sp. NM-2]|uniref:hypothetical protein n=1 Tax=Rhodococcus TaxID=1827 RepID=UPI0024748C25|nr:hypothetical protein [Rhodococcus opacus]
MYTSELHSVELQVDLSRFEHIGSQCSASQSDQRIGIVTLPQLDALPRGQPDSRENNRLVRRCVLRHLSILTVAS